VKPWFELSAWVAMSGLSPALHARQCVSLRDLSR
jgi:hypothetical protein